MNIHPIIINKLTKQDIYKDGRLLPASIVMELLMNKTALQASFILQKQLMVYNPHKGFMKHTPIVI